MRVVCVWEIAEVTTVMLVGEEKRRMFTTIQRRLIP